MQTPHIPTGVARYQDLVASMGRSRLRAALDGGLLIQPWRGVVIRADAMLGLRSRAAAAVMAVGNKAVLSGPTAVALHGHEAADSADIHLTVPYSRSARSRPGLIVHQNRFSPSDIVEIGGLPVFSHDLALAEYLCDGDKWAAFASLDHALNGLDDILVNGMKSTIRERLDARDDPRGIAKALTLTELATGKADSPPESWFRLIVVEAGFPIPEPQYEIRTVDGQLLYVLDMAWVERRIALEYDGYATHESRLDYDAERDKRLAGRGWITVRARAEDLKDPSRVLNELRTAFDQRAR